MTTTTVTEEQVLDAWLDGLVARAGGDPERGVQPPPAEAFVDEGGERTPFLPAPELADLAAQLLARHTHLAHLLGLEVVYLWKAEGGKSAGQDVLGKCQKPSGLLRHFSQADFVIWLAADHLRARLLSARQVEALLYHELLHTAIDDEGRPAVRGHDWAGFTREIEHYGLYLEDIRRIDQALRQTRLPGLEGGR